MAETLLTVKNLLIKISQAANVRTIINELNLEIAKSQCVALVGESGSGKSMTALAIMQLLPIAARVSDQSQIIFQDNNLLNFSERQMRTIRGSEIGMIFQDAMTALNPVFTIGQQMLEVLCPNLGLSRRKAKGRALQLLTEVGITDPKRTLKAYPHQLSGGMRQRAMIALALCGDPKLIIADEPTTALDVTIQAQVITLLKELQQEKHLALLFISHDLALVSQIADDICVLQKGKCVESTRANIFFAHPQHSYSKKLLAALPLLSPQREMTEASPLLIIKKLRIYFSSGGRLFKTKHNVIKAVDDVDLQLLEGQTLALVGESGSGKTTTAKSIVRLLDITSGEIFFREQNLTTLGRRDFRQLRRQLQIIFQDPYSALDPRKIIADSLMEGMVAQGILRSRKERLAQIDKLLAQVELPLDAKWRYPHEFSGGERQRLCIARVLALHPSLLILDEPTSALDVSIQKQILNLLLTLQARHRLTYLLITHNIGVVAHMAQMMAVMYQGKIVEQGPTARILEAPEHPYTKALLAAVPVLKHQPNPEKLND